ncbi:hypothetical protein [Moorena sp. SIO3H5]|uniref:hypothetical protein n=1 Tax=Moorena sp. SIO3H5 TaxID=2607834 RepID=UPI0013BD9A11|nr:hypothetical protein [Moorena sp. SIO3H5]NEO69492.1 hypothetical protein [Moorena sp. SIO3H5]
MTSKDIFKKGGFESSDFTNWQTIGDAIIETEVFGISPTQGSYQALITNGNQSVSIAQLESFLGLNTTELDQLGNGNVNQGSAIQFIPITVEAGDILRFDWNFITNENTSNNVYNDFAFVSISSGDVLELADTTSDFVASTTSFNSQTGYKTFTYEFTTAGTFTFSIGVVDMADSTVDSGLLIDNLTLNGLIFEDDFDPDRDNSQWAEISNGEVNTNFGGDGNSLWFDGGSAEDNSRYAITQALDVSGGGTISFDLIIGNIIGNSNNGGENADSGEDIALEYSIDSGISWVRLGLYDTEDYISWTTITESIDTDAITSATQFRWLQVNHSGSGFDNWAIDNVHIDLL